MKIALAEFAAPWPEQGLAPAAVLEKLDRLGSPATMASAGPRYFGFVTGGGLPAALAADWLISAWDQNAFSSASSPLGAALETVCLGWLREIFGFPETAGGAFVTGATMANFTGLAAARHAVLARVGWDVERDGLFGAPPHRRRWILKSSAAPEVFEERLGGCFVAEAFSRG